jgi:methyltransferase small
MQQFHIEPKRLQFVSKNPDTAPWLFLLEGRKGGKPFLNVLPQFYIRDGETDSEAVRNLYRLPEEQEVQP